MKSEAMRWMSSNEQVHYTEEEINQLVKKPLDPQGAKIHVDDELVARGGLNTLISTRDLPANPKEGEGYQVGDVYWTWANGRWMTTTGLYGQ